MTRWTLLLAIASAAACDSQRGSDSQTSAQQAGASGQPASSAREPTVQAFTIAADGADPVKIEIAIPATWTVDTSDPDAPMFRIPGAQRHWLTFAALPWLRGDAKEQMAKAIELQFGDGARAKREDLPHGRVWVSEDQDRQVHARLFVPYDGGVLMAIALLEKSSAEKLPEVRKIFETIEIVH